MVALGQPASTTRECCSPSCQHMVCWWCLPLCRVHFKILLQTCMCALTPGLTVALR